MVTVSVVSSKLAVTGVTGASPVKQARSASVSSKAASNGVTGASRATAFGEAISSKEAVAGVTGASDARETVTDSPVAGVKVPVFPAKRRAACRVNADARIRVVAFIFCFV